MSTLPEVDLESVPPDGYRFALVGRDPKTWPSRWRVVHLVGFEDDYESPKTLCGRSHHGGAVGAFAGPLCTACLMEFQVLSI